MITERRVGEHDGSEHRAARPAQIERVQGNRSQQFDAGVAVEAGAEAATQGFDNLDGTLAPGLTQREHRVRSVVVDLMPHLLDARGGHAEADGRHRARQGSLLLY